MLRTTVIALLLFTGALVETALFPYLTLAGYRPDVLLLLTAAFALRDGPMTGVLVGFAAGLLGDLLLVQPVIGLTTVVFVAIGYVVGVVRPYLAVGSVTPPIVVAFATGLLGTLGYAVLSRLLGDPRYTPELVTQASIVVALYNTLLAPLAFPLVNLLSSRFPPARTSPL